MIFRDIKYVTKKFKYSSHKHVDTIDDFFKQWHFSCMDKLRLYEMIINAHSTGTNASCFSTQRFACQLSSYPNSFTQNKHSIGKTDNATAKTKIADHHHCTR